VTRRDTGAANTNGRDDAVTPDLRDTAPRRGIRRRSRRPVLKRDRSERPVAIRRAAIAGEPAVRRRSVDRDAPSVISARAVEAHPDEGPSKVSFDPGDRHAAPDAMDGDPVVADPPATSPGGLEGAATPDRSGLVPGVLAAICLVMVAATGRMQNAAIGRILIPAAGILAAIAFGQVLARRHPDEHWLPNLLVAGVVVKLGASVARFYTLISESGTHGDASVYDDYGRRLAHAWASGGVVPDYTSGASGGTVWVRWFTGIVYYVFGSNILNGFLIFSLLALIGTYFWYRAAVEAVPFLNKRLCFLLLFFAPSIAFWPSSIGKEALMQLGLGSLALGTARLLRQRLFQGILIALPGAWLLYNVRPHLLAFATFAAGGAYVIGRVRRRRGTAESASLFRPVGMVIVALLAFFALNQAAEFLGMKDFSINSIEQELNQQTGRTAQGGSQVETGKVSLTPLSVPQGMVKVLLQPFPWEVETRTQLLASLECAVMAVFILFRIRSLTFSLRRARGTPFLIYCWTFVLLYAITFSAIANYGLLTRQRSLVLPAFFALLAVEPSLAASNNGRSRPGVPAGIPVARRDTSSGE
jgi:hypothetical protein